MPLTGGAVLATNHLSAIDPPLIGNFCPRAVYYMAKAELLATPIIGEILQWTGAFPVRRGEGGREALRRARELVREGHVVGMFVEGTRQRFGYPGPVHTGGVIIAKQEGDPVIPCGLESFRWSRKNRRPCAIVWGEPISLDGLPRNGSGYREAADIVPGELVRLWRLGAEAVAARFPRELSDGTRRSGPIPPARLARSREPALTAR